MLEAHNEIQKAKLAAIELDVTFAGTNTTEKDLLYGQIQNGINQYESMVRSTYIGGLIRHFYYYSTDYFFATEEK